MLTKSNPSCDPVPLVKIFCSSSHEGSIVRLVQNQSKERVDFVKMAYSENWLLYLMPRVSTEFRQHGIPRNFLTSEVISAQFRRNSAEFRGIPRNFAGIAPEITSVFRGMPKCHFRGHPTNAISNLGRLWPLAKDICVRHADQRDYKPWTN
jgi:hypothetical protein